MLWQKIRKIQSYFHFLSSQLPVLLCSLSKQLLNVEELSAIFLPWICLFVFLILSHFWLSPRPMTEDASSLNYMLQKSTSHLLITWLLSCCSCREYSFPCFCKICHFACACLFHIPNPSFPGWRVSFFDIMLKFFPNSDHSPPLSSS